MLRGGAGKKAVEGQGHSEEAGGDDGHGHGKETAKGGKDDGHGHGSEAGGHEEEPENAEAYAGLIRAHIAADNLDQAEGFLGAVPAKIATAAPVEAARAQLALARQAAKAGPLDGLKAKVEADPADHQARFDYATALHAGGDVEEAVNQLLELFRRDREWNEGAAKTQLFTIFEALKPNDPIGIKGRRRLSSMIFA